MFGRSLFKQSSANHLNFPLIQIKGADTWPPKGFNRQQFSQSMSENHSRSIAKAVSWRITGTIDTIIVSYVVTGRITLAISIGFVEVFTKIGLYYLHERVWNRISYGRPKKGDYEI